jgi:hypothetical protein
MNNFAFSPILKKMRRKTIFAITAAKVFFLGKTFVANPQNFVANLQFADYQI